MEQLNTCVCNSVSETMNIAQISHEIRNPLTLISCTLQLLNGRYPQLKSDDLWIQLANDVDYLKQLTLSLSNFNQGGQITLVPVNLSILLNHLAKQYLFLAQNQKKHLLLSIADDIPIISCDEIKIRQALINLIKNAFEATSPGDTLEISARAAARRVIISVKDTGIGIPSEQLPEIFCPFTTHKQAGTGLGLSITQKIIAAHRGSIQVYSREHVGTKFVISLPISQK